MRSRGGPVISQVRHQLGTAEADENEPYIAATVARAPRMTEEQAAYLRRLFKYGPAGHDNGPVIGGSHQAVDIGTIEDIDDAAQSRRSP